MEDVGIFYVNSVYFTAICHILWPISIFSGYLIYIFLFWYFVAIKIWQPWSRKRLKTLFRAKAVRRSTKGFIINMDQRYIPLNFVTGSNTT
jgi:hypothetical protein